MGQKTQKNWLRHWWQVAINIIVAIIGFVLGLLVWGDRWRSSWDVHRPGRLTCGLAFQGLEDACKDRPGSPSLREITARVGRDAPGFHLHVHGYSQQTLRLSTHPPTCQVARLSRVLRPHGLRAARALGDR